MIILLLIKSLMDVLKKFFFLLANRQEAVPNLILAQLLWFSGHTWKGVSLCSQRSAWWMPSSTTAFWLSFLKDSFFLFSALSRKKLDTGYPLDLCLKGVGKEWPAGYFIQHGRSYSWRNINVQQYILPHTSLECPSSKLWDTGSYIQLALNYKNTFITKVPVGEKNVLPWKTMPCL